MATAWSFLALATLIICMSHELHAAPPPAAPLTLSYDNVTSPFSQNVTTLQNADLFNRGVLDVIGCSLQGPVFILLNDPNFPGVFQAPTCLLSVSSCAWIETADMDADGYLDIILGASFANVGNCLTWFRNGGNASAAQMFDPMPNVIAQGCKRALDFRARDMNADNFTDVVFLQDQQLWVAFSNDTAGSWNLTRIDSAHTYDTVDVGDFDNDGILDIVANRATGPYQGWVLYGGLNWTSECITNNGHVNRYTTRIATGDLNKDGWLDVGQSRDPNTAANGLHLNDATPAFGSFPAVVMDQAGVTSHGADYIRMVDFNNDGWLDIITPSNSDQAVYYYQNQADGRGNLLPRVALLTASVGFASATVGDFNNDGIPDLITGTHGDVPMAAIINSGQLCPVITSVYTLKAGETYGTCTSYTPGFQCSLGCTGGQSPVTSTAGVCNAGSWTLPTIDCSQAQTTGQGTTGQGGTATNTAGKGQWSDGTEVFECEEPAEIRCVGGSQCGEGYTGDLCAACIPGYFLRGSECVPCGGYTNQVPLYIVTAIVFVVFAILQIVLEDSKISYAISFFKALQILRIAGTKSGYNLPGAVKDFNDNLSLITLDYSFLKPACSSSTESPTYSNVFWGNAVLLVCFVVPPMLILSGLAIFHKKKREFWLNRLSRTAIIMVDLIFFIVCTRAIQSTTCVKLGNVFVLKYSSDSCKPEGPMVVGALALVFFVPAVPLAMLGGLLYLHRSGRLTEASVVARVGYAYRGTRMNGLRFLNEVVRLIQVLLVTIAWNTFPNNSSPYAFTAATYLVLFAATIVWRPFDTPRRNAMSVFSIGLGTLSSCVNLATYSSFAKESGVSAVVILAVTVVAAAIGVYVFEARQLKRNLKLKANNATASGGSMSSLSDSSASSSSATSRSRSASSSS